MDFKSNFPLAPLTTLKIGGPADSFVETKSSEELIEILKSTPASTPITILGNGSNVLISDTGIRGLVIRHQAKNITIQGNQNINQDITKTPNGTSTHRTENEPQKYLDFASLDYDESDQPRVKVILDAGVPLPYAINYLIGQGVTGLQWFAYIPGTIGGATWYNIHGGKYNLSSYIDSVAVYDRSSQKQINLSAKDLNWDYELSPFQANPNYYILATTFNLYRGDAIKANEVVKAWIAQKAKVQPMNSAGSTFQNPSLEDSVKNWGEQKSTGWIIDHELGWKGKQIGGAQISLQHANFIVNTGSATAIDYLSLANMVIDEVQKRFNFKLKLEVKLLGDFDPTILRQ